jgi:hypothetical protein
VGSSEGYHLELAGLLLDTCQRVRPALCQDPAVWSSEVQRRVDIINATNSDTVLTYNQTYNPTPSTALQAWLPPTSVLTPRFVKVSAQIDF